MRAILIALAIVALVAIAKADDTTTQAPDTFFGVDRNDEEAVKNKHEELSDEQFKRMFGEDHPVPDFFGDVEPEPKNFVQKIHEAVKKFGDLFTSTTKAPEKTD